ncbi:hypothetical protein HMN09_00399300 [Mycena chlorophos]|uniref:Uncharacterized protein n=1 Tax=Mycena chlorophos TaxID=658473 RepID=A0A8H6TFN5_MYCCL|nr:hypothetical protein HMN09_00399300 [Mycena chlorophos]
MRPVHLLLLLAAALALPSICTSNLVRNPSMPTQILPATSRLPPTPSSRICPPSLTHIDRPVHAVSDDKLHARPDPCKRRTRRGFASNTTANGDVRIDGGRRQGALQRPDPVAVLSETPADAGS